ncbi:MAG: amidohydrolase family protein [Ilumatobacteraceae bacterium]|nr:amidohydrolase family protein [Ilumatobacteraceae bacterium]
MTRLPGACDTHVHVYDQRYPLSATTVLTPPDASVDDYRAVQAELGLERVVFVQPTTYGLDNRCQLDAVAEVGSRARAVVVVDDRADADTIARLAQQGAVGVRFHMLPGGAVPWEMLSPVARTIADHGWHVQLQLNGRELPERLDALLDLPTPLVIDHVGRFTPPVRVDEPAFGALLTLIETGRCWVKLSAPYESTTEGAPDYPAVATLAHRLIEVAPERMLWASNWPHPSQTAPVPNEHVNRLLDAWLPTAELQQQVLVDNPAEVYGFPSITKETS